MWSLAVPWWELVVRSVVVYLALLAVLRIFGKREVGQFTLFDLVVILLVANAVQPAMTGPDFSLLGGLIIIATLMVMDRAIAVARARIRFVRGLLESQPTVIARDGQWIKKAMEQEDVTIEDAEMALREHGFSSIREVEVAVLEADGSISVVPRDKRDGMEGRRPRRRMRVVRHL